LDRLKVTAYAWSGFIHDECFDCSRHFLMSLEPVADSPAGYKVAAMTLLTMLFVPGMLLNQYLTSILLWNLVIHLPTVIRKSREQY